MKDQFVIIVTKPEIKDKGVIRVSPACYKMLAEAKQRTGLPVGALAEKCVTFALDRLEVVYEEDD